MQVPLPPRPAALTWFELCLGASQALRIGNIALHSAAMAAATGIDRQAILISPFANAVVVMGLGAAVSRGRFALARWFLVVLVGLDLIGLGGLSAGAQMLGVPFAATSGVAIVLMLAAGVLMFLPTVTAWLKHGKDG